MQLACICIPWAIKIKLRFAKLILQKNAHVDVMQWANVASIARMKRKMIHGVAYF